MQINNQLGHIRQEKGMSQERLSWTSSVSRHTISEIELKKRIPSLKTALLLARALNCSVEDIFTLEDKNR